MLYYRLQCQSDGAAQRLAQKEHVEIRLHIIYKLTDDIQAALTGMLERRTAR